MADDGSNTSVYRVLLSRFRELEVSHSRLTEQLEEVVRKKEAEEERKMIRYNSSSSSGEESWHRLFPGVNSVTGPYNKVLQSMGHAVHVCRAFDGKIIFWNRSAETLYGWKEYEALGQRATDLITDEQYHSSIEKIMESLITGQSWSGQFPFKKRSGEIFTALVTKSPLYEDVELVGVITVSCDAAVFNIINKELQRTYQDHANAQSRERKFNMKKIQWNPPQIASSVSSLASKVFSVRQGDADSWSACSSSRERDDSTLDSVDGESEKESSRTRRSRPGKYGSDGNSSRKEESILGFVQPSKLAAIVREKLNIGGNNNNMQEENKTVSPCDSTGIPARNDVRIDLNHVRASKGESLSSHNSSSTEIGADADQIKCVISDKGEYDRKGKEFLGTHKEESPAVDGNHFVSSWLESYECPGPDEAFEEDVFNQKPQVSRSSALSSPSESNISRENSLTKGDKESDSMDDCEINWDDLHLGEDIGQGSYATVYRGVWHGSDVAIKVYSENDYRESTLLDYKKEIAIMKKLRHPNVLLFMGAVYSPERLAIVTEFLPRGSLFRTLHRNYQTLDIRRRLKMSLDVARGMNYLHRRNPPIVHRDLKSSNLLVDRSWGVKVGDFGLSKWKNATYLTARSGRGTPQWMAPEVLRNEPSNEKSDVFSFGVVLWELLTQSIPWVELNALQVVGVVGFMDRRLDLPESMDPRFSSLINECWRSDPQSRPSFQNLIERMGDLIQTFPPAPNRADSAP